jgi:hypothetical protein
MGSQAGAWKLTDIFGSEAEPLDMGSQAGAWKLIDILVVSYEGAITAKA